MNVSNPAILQTTSGDNVPLQGVTARGTVRGLLFELEVEQRYRNSGETNIEAVYTFPLPSDAVLLGLEVELDGRKLTAAVVEKKAAEENYEKALDKGDSAIMLERGANGLLTMNLGNLMAGENAVIRYRYAQLLRFEQGSVRLAIPTVIAPRYGDPAAAGLAPHQVPETALTASYPFTLTVEFEGAIADGTIASPSHRIATARTDQGVSVSLPHDGFLDRDLVLNIGGLAGQSLAIVGRDGDQYVALASFCANVPAKSAALPLRLKVLVDCSGSMAGDSIGAAKRALHLILAGLTPADRFAFSRFGSRVVHETTGMRVGNAAEVRAGSERVEFMDADLGGTEMTTALQEVFAFGEKGEASDVLLITDGEVWDEGGLVAAARAAHQRVFVVGIGSAPAEGVLRNLAESSGGACEFVAPMEDAEAAILRMFARLRAPRIASAKIDWPTQPLWMSPLPSGLFGGETVHAFAGFNAAPAGDAVLHLVPADESAPLTARIALPTDVIAERTLARMAAARRIDTADSAAKLQMALDYSLLTDRTNLLVIHERAAGEKAGDLPALSTLPQMLAAGWHGMGSVHEESSNAVMRRTVFGREVRPAAYAHFSESCSLSTYSDIGSLDLVPDNAQAFGDVNPPIAQRHAALPDDSSLTTLIQALATNTGALPKDIGDLVNAGLPLSWLDCLTQFLADGASETDVVRAFLEAIGIGALRGWLPAPLPREVARTLRHVFADATTCAELRAQMQENLRLQLESAGIT
jgi:Ca-activated chloride channel family protein